MALNVKILSRCDTEANWQEKNPTLLNGEIAISQLLDEAGNVAASLIKIGDGKTAYNNLDFSLTNAADVYEWAKAENKPEYTTDDFGSFLKLSYIYNNTDANPVLTLENYNEFRCGTIENSIGATIPEIPSTVNNYSSAVIFTTEENAVSFNLNNNSGYPLIYTGSDVFNGYFMPTIQKRYRVNFLFDGAYILAYVSAIALPLEALGKPKNVSTPN